MTSAPGLFPDEARLRALLRGDATEIRAVEALARSVIRRRAFGIAPEEVDDLVQECMAQLWVACSVRGFALRAGLDAFVRTIATARCIDHFRRRRWQEEIDDLLEADTVDPIETVHRDRLVARLRAAVAQLKPLCRDLIRWHFQDGQRYEEIALREGRNPSTLRVHMFQCLRQLRSTIGLDSEQV